MTDPENETTDADYLREFRAWLSTVCAPGAVAVVFCCVVAAPADTPVGWLVLLLVGATVSLGSITAITRGVAHALSLTMSWLAVAVVVLAERAGEWPDIASAALLFALLGTFLLPQKDTSP